jgi:hypothetical protein
MSAVPAAAPEVGRTDLVVVASDTEARLYVREHGDGPLVALQTLRPRGGRTVAGRPEDTPHDAPHDPAHAAREAFAHALAHRLEVAFAVGRLDELELFVAPAFNGELRAHLGPRARRHLRLAVAVDLLQGAPDEIERRLRGLLLEATDGGPRPPPARLVIH